MAWSDAARQAAAQVRRQHRRGIIKPVVGYHGTDRVFSAVRASKKSRAYATMSIRQALMYSRMASLVSGKPAVVLKVRLPIKGSLTTRRLNNPAGFASRKSLPVVGVVHLRK
ncbi:MAG: hypothetical protein NUV75_01310 [Gallionella sp.]|nr:hypothetical protein [Gallionella sp.]